MASYACRNPPHSAQPSDSSEQKTFAPSNTRPSDVPAPDALALDTLVPAPVLAKYSIKDLQAMTKVCIDLFLQAQARRSKSHRERQLKAKLPNLYYDKTHMEYYHFCQQCENHFATANAIDPNCTPFAASFFCS